MGELIRRSYTPVRFAQGGDRSGSATASGGPDIEASLCELKIDGKAVLGMFVLKRYIPSAAVFGDICHPFRIGVVVGGESVLCSETMMDCFGESPSPDKRDVTCPL